MKKIITFGQHNATLERVKSAATLQLNTIPANTPLYMPLAELADAMNQVEFFHVISIFPGKGKIVFTVSKEATNAGVIDATCNVIAEMLDTDIVVSNERAEETV